jgi:hypothetical protein
MEQRKTFYIGNDSTNPIRAGGVIIYRKTKDNNIDLLLIFSRGIYEDIGGRTDNEDNDIYETVAREVGEETNQIIVYDSIRDRLNNAKYVYFSKSKYVIFLVEATDKESRLTSEIFGETEIHDNISRLIQWVSLDTVLESSVIKYKLNYRMKNPLLFNKLKNIQNSMEEVFRFV